MELRPAEPIEYQECAIAFVDVLGFAQLVERSEVDQEARILLARVIATADLFAEHMTFARMGTPNFFSDSILLSMIRPADNIFYLVREIGLLARYLLSMGFATRGGITTGPLYHQGKAVVGPALVRAYRIEQRAFYPRIILDDAALQHWQNEFRPASAHPEDEQRVKRDRDGQSFIDLFNSSWQGAVQMSWVYDQAHEVPDDPVRYRQIVRPHIETGCASRDPKISAKWEWLASECGRLEDE